MADNFQLKAIITAVDKMSPALKGINRAVKGVHKSLKDIGKAGGELMSKIGLPAGLAFLGVSLGAKQAIESILEYGGALQDASDRTGMSVEMLQALRWNAGLAGVEAEALDASMVKLNKALAEGAAGDAGMQGLFRAMRVPLRDAHHQVRALGDVLPEIAESFKNTINPAVRTKMAMTLFGKEGTKLVPMLAMGKAGIKDLMAEAERLGITINKDAVSSLDDMGDSLSTVSQQLRGQFGKVVASVAPMITPLLGSLQEWIAANKDLIRANVSEGIKEVVSWVKSVDWQKVGADIKDVFNGVASFVSAMGGVKGVMLLLAASFLAGPLAALLSIGGAVFRLTMLFSSLGGGMLASIAPLQSVTKGLKGAELRAATLTNTVGRLGAAAGIAGAAFAGWAVGSWLNDNVINPAVAMLTGKEGNTLGGWVYDITHKQDPNKDFTPFQSKESRANFLQSTPSPLISAANRGNQQPVTGEVKVTFEGAPPGMRVAPPQGTSPLFNINTDVGYRTGFLGMPG